VSAHTGALEAVDRIVNRGGDVPAEVVAALHDRLFAWVALVPGPEAGTRGGDEIVVGVTAGVELRAVPRAPSPRDLPLLERVALLVSAHVPAR